MPPLRTITREYPVSGLLFGTFFRDRRPFCFLIRSAISHCPQHACIEPCYFGGLCYPTPERGICRPDQQQQPQQQTNNARGDKTTRPGNSTRLFTFAKSPQLHYYHRSHINRNLFHYQQRRSSARLRYSLLLLAKCMGLCQQR